MAEQDKILAEKLIQITSLKAQIQELQPGSSPVQELQTPGELVLPKSQMATVPEHHDRI